MVATRARRRQYDLPGERPRRQRRRATAHLAGADLRLGPGAGDGTGRRRLGIIAAFAGGSVALIGYLRSPRSIVTLAFAGVPLQRQLFAEILKVGIPALINTGITNLSVVVLTGIAGHLGRATAIGYAMGARLEYILVPLAFGFGAAIVATVGANWGARQYQRARNGVDRPRDGGGAVRGDRPRRRGGAAAVDGIVRH